MKIIFIDTEFTGERQNTTLISIGIITLEGDSLYITLNDYDGSQITPWLKDNVLNSIDEKTSVSSKEAASLVNSFLNNYSEGEKISIVSWGLSQDLILFFELFKYLNIDNIDDYHYLYHLPDYLQHHCGIDLATLFLVSGIDLGISRAQYAGVEDEVRHNSLSDAKVVRKCFLRLLKEKIFSLLRNQVF